MEIDHRPRRLGTVARTSPGVSASLVDAAGSRCSRRGRRGAAPRPREACTPRGHRTPWSARRTRWRPEEQPPSRPSGRRLEVTSALAVTSAPASVRCRASEVATSVRPRWRAGRRLRPTAAEGLDLDAGQEDGGEADDEQDRLRPVRLVHAGTSATDHSSAADAIGNRPPARTWANGNRPARSTATAATTRTASASVVSTALGRAARTARSSTVPVPATRVPPESLRRSPPTTATTQRADGRDDGPQRDRCERELPRAPSPRVAAATRPSTRTSGAGPGGGPRTPAGGRAATAPRGRDGRTTRAPGAAPPRLG